MHSRKRKHFVVHPTSASDAFWSWVWRDDYSFFDAVRRKKVQVEYDTVTRIAKGTSKDRHIYVVFYVVKTITNAATIRELPPELSVFPVNTESYHTALLPEFRQILRYFSRASALIFYTLLISILAGAFFLAKDDIVSLVASLAIARNNCDAECAHSVAMLITAFWYVLVLIITGFIYPALHIFIIGRKQKIAYFRWLARMECTCLAAFSIVGLIKFLVKAHPDMDTWKKIHLIFF